MGLVACKCPQCGADLEFDESRDMMFCQYCGSKILKTNVIQNITNNVTNNIQTDNLNVSAQLDVDTMFYNWLVSQNSKLKQDLSYYYADDDRAKFSKLVSLSDLRICTEWDFCLHEEVRENYNKALQIAYKLSDNPKYKPYLDEYVEAIRKRISSYDESVKRQEAYRREKEEYEKEKQREKERREATLIGKIEKIYKFFFKYK